MKLNTHLNKILILGLIVSGLAFQGCSSKKATTDESDLASPTTAIQEEALGDSDSGKALGLQTVNFAYDSFALDSHSKEVLKGNAKVLKDKPSARVQVEGHCDQRGGIQYNIALGEKRASIVKKYLEDQGIAGDRLSTISYGKERLVDTAMTESAFAKNRRANFVITSR